MTHSPPVAAGDIVAAAAEVAEELFAGAAARDAAASFPDDAFALLHAAALMMAPFPARLGGAGLVEPDAAGALCHVLRAIGGGDLSVGRLYEGHVNAVALVARYGTPKQLAALADDVRAGAMSGVWNAEGALPATLERDGAGWRLRGAKILASGVGSVTRPLVPVARGEATVMTIPHLGAGERADLSRWTAQGMRSTCTGTVDLEGLPVGPGQVIGGDDDYRRQPNFFGGAWRFCAVQLGAVERLLDLYRADLNRLGRGAHPYQRQRIAACATAAETAALWVEQAARTVAAEARPAAEVLAYVGLARGVTERAGLDVVEAVHRGLGLNSFMRPHPAERVARDLATYLRQPAPDGAMADAAAAVLAAPAPARTLWRDA
ncbi:acyl-CoA dehydrogenase family protein [Lichenibacterium dinghuense]|uniref:acyl-CoA dehydrogenase family protein n=1 Tax=Lichenibacterium dinghuense TaxID=2895977 RepID=UPI001F282BD5|nr:acyl-CoA dehydrogenase family protein [Lichenibacterium sp. 6Y81]